MFTVYIKEWQTIIADVSQAATDETYLRQWRCVAHHLYAVSGFRPRTSMTPCDYLAHACERDVARLHAALNVDAESSVLSPHAVVMLHAGLVLVAHLRAYCSLPLQHSN